jgi:hypothetical protein
LSARFFLTVSVPQENHNFISRRLIMKRLSILLLLLVFCSTAVQAQAQASKPAPEPKKLSVIVGHWTIEGEDKPGPLGPGGKFTGEMTCHMILGGSFLQCQVSEKLAEGEMRFLEIDGYDPVNKNFSTEGFFGGGGGWSGVITIAGNTWTYAAKIVIAGKQYQYKGAFVFAPDLASGTYKDELSADGKTWAPWTDSKWTKLQPAPKK